MYLIGRLLLVFSVTLGDVSNVTYRYCQSTMNVFRILELIVLASIAAPLSRKNKKNSNSEEPQVSLPGRSLESE